MSEKTTENEMSFLGHLEELRWRLVRSVIVILIIAVVLFYFTDPIVKLVYLNMSKTNFPTCLLYTSPSPRDGIGSRMPSSA